MAGGEENGKGMRERNKTNKGDGKGKDGREVMRNRQMDRERRREGMEEERRERIT